MGYARDHFRDLARYNAWANERLYAACAGLTEADYLRPRPAFFKSIHGTLNHVLVGDRLWLARFEGHRTGITALDQTLYGDLAGLRVARRAEDARIAAFVEGLADRDLERPLAYRNIRGESHVDPLGRLLTHLFNHQTHHRGQVHDQLSQTPVAPPPLDFVYFLHEA